MVSSSNNHAPTPANSEREEYIVPSSISPEPTVLKCYEQTPLIPASGTMEGVSWERLYH